MIMTYRQRKAIRLKVQVTKAISIGGLVLTTALVVFAAMCV